MFRLQQGSHPGSLRRLAALCGCWGCAVMRPSGPAVASEVLDDILNTMKLDARSGGSPDFDRWLSIRRDQPVGQSFVVSEAVEQIARIAVGVGYWNEEWTADESLVLTLYDSPRKTTKLASFAMPYKWRSWEEAILIFPLHATLTLPSPRGRGQGEGARGSHYFELTVEGGDGRIDGIYLSPPDYGGGQAFVAGEPQPESDLWFEVHVKYPADRENNLRAFLDAFDLAQPELRGVQTAVEAGDLDRACDELVAHFEGREDLCPRAHRRPDPDADWDQEACEAALHMQVLTEDGVVELGPDWNYLAEWPTRGGVGLTRSGLRKHLAGAYHATGDEAYAIAFNEMMQSFFRSYPSPIKSGVISGQERIGPTFGSGMGGGSLWASLSIAARMGHGFAYYSYFVDSPHFERDTRVAWLGSLVDMADVLALMDAGGNWETQNASALYEFGLTYPELRKARQWVEAGFRMAVENLMATTHPDGPLCEATTNYHALCTNRFLGMLEKPNPFGLVLPPEARLRVERMVEYIAYSLQPDGTMPAWGDSNYAPGTELVRRGAELFGREDFRYIASGGREGKVPPKRSVSFPHGGYYVMRSDWSPAARYLCLHNGHSTSHGHFDALSIIVGAYGRLLVLDPGIYIYGTPEAHELTQTRSHSTVEVDGANTVNGDGVTRWRSLPHVDYIDGTNRGYQGVEGVRHRRQILFVKPEYWLVADSVTGPGTHSVVQRFQLKEGTVEAGQAAGAVLLRTSEGAGLHVVTVGATGSPALEKGNSAYERTELTPLPVLAYRYGGPLPCHFGQLLLPVPDQGYTVQFVDLSGAATGLQPGDVALSVTTPLGRSVCALCTGERRNVELPVGAPTEKLRFSGTACVLRQDDSGRVVSLSGIGVSDVHLGQVALVSETDCPVDVDLTRDGSAVRVVTRPRSASGAFRLPGAEAVHRSLPRDA